MRIAEQVGFFTGLGIVIVAIASAAFGRINSLPSEVVAEPATVPAETTETAERTETTETTEPVA
jgi:hypothetical protein